MHMFLDEFYSPRTAAWGMGLALNVREISSRFHF